MADPATFARNTTALADSATFCIRRSPRFNSVRSSFLAFQRACGQERDRPFRLINATCIGQGHYQHG